MNNQWVDELEHQFKEGRCLLIKRFRGTEKSGDLAEPIM
jgi:hypothetical protein